jgi:cobalt-zinc-cadmium efflux system protein
MAANHNHKPDHNNSHSHSHSHSHSSQVREDNQRRLTIVLILAAAFMVVEFFGGLLTGSLALLADAGHMFSDVAALVLSLFAFRMARRPATATRTYGFHRTEILAALFNGATLIAIAGVILVEAYRRVVSPQEVQGLPMLGIAVTGLAVNVIGLVVLHGSHRGNLNMKGAYLHVMSDALGSVGAIMAGAAVWLFGWYRADPIISAVIALLIVWSSWNLLRQSVAVLMEGAPGGIDVDEVEAAIKEVPGVCGLHDLHVWTITSGFHALSAHAVMAGDVPPEDWSRILEEIRSTVHDKFGIDHVTIQVEPLGFAESGPCR